MAARRSDANRGFTTYPSAPVASASRMKYEARQAAYLLGENPCYDEQLPRSLPDGITCSAGELAGSGPSKGEENATRTKILPPWRESSCLFLGGFGGSFGRAKKNSFWE